VLAWIVRRVEGTAGATETPIGLVPAPDDLDLDGLDIGADDLEQLLTVDDESLRAELPQVREHLATFGDQLPAPVRRQFQALEQQLGA
jgi:phosphoenolpyruvate carboxykinase (GTP)